MRKLLYVLCIFILFVALLGANNSIVPVKIAERATPGESFGAGIGHSGASTDETLELFTKPELKNPLRLDITVNPLASGSNQEKGVVLSQMRALSDVVDSVALPSLGCNGSEWNGRYIYIVSSINPSDSSVIRVFDPEDGSTVEQWRLTFTGMIMGIAFVNNSMYVSDWTNGMIRKVNPVTHALLTSFLAPGDTFIRGITSDGTDLYVGVAGSVDSLYKIDTLGSIIESWYIGSFCDWVMDLACDTRDGTMWLVDDNTDQIMKVDMGGSVIAAFTAPGNPGDSIPEGISFDGSDLWFNTLYGNKLYRIDGGHSLSRIALFQDSEPWGQRAIKDILYNNGIPFKVFGSADIGKVDLSIYTKAIISSTQDRIMGDTIAAYKSWWESWISSGGVLQISGATHPMESWEGLTLPGDYSLMYNSGLGQNLLDITSRWHPLVNQPYVIDDSSLDNWNNSSHGYLTNLSGHYTVVQDTASRPVLAIKRLGDGGIIASQMTLEYAWGSGYSPILENVIKYWQYGVSTNVLFALADADQPWLKNALLWRDSLIGNIDYMDVSSYSPILEDLNMYDVVLTRPNSSYASSVATGYTLSTYVNQGGKVILGAACWFGLPIGLAGAIMDSTYNPFYMVGAGNHYSYANLGWYDAGHSIMDGITTLSEWIRDSVGVYPGADTVAKYDDGEYLLAYKILPSDGIVVGYNVFFGDTVLYYTYGQGVKLLSNIIDWSAEYAGIEDVTELGDGLDILGISSPIMTGSEWLNLSIDSPASVELRIINIAGMIVSSKNLNYTTPGVKRVEFDVSELPSGPYFLSVKTSKGKAIRKALVIR